jgi:hypothetical protein
VQTTAFDPTHAPLLHESVWVHALLSLQVVPSASGVHAVVLTDGVQTSQPLLDVVPAA